MKKKKERLFVLIFIVIISTIIGNLFFIFFKEKKKISKEYCEIDSDGIRVQNSCCETRALNKKYKEDWDKIQEPCNLSCTAMWDWGYSVCEKNECILVYLLESKCNEDSDCASYEIGCINKKYIERIGINKLQIKEINELDCKCNNSLCEILN